MPIAGNATAQSCNVVGMVTIVQSFLNPIGFIIRRWRFLLIKKNNRTATAHPSLNLRWQQKFLIQKHKTFAHVTG
jgi:hypothetical protein